MAIDAAVDNEGLFIPLIDFSKFLDGDAVTRQETAKSVLHGFQTAGFIYLQNHPIAADKAKRIFSLSANFFAQPEEDKLALSWTTPNANRGYSRPGREKLSRMEQAGDVAKMRTAVPDIKESFEIGRDNEEEHPNQWPVEPESIAGFKTEMKDFFSECQALHAEVMRAIAVAMDLGETFFDNFINVGDNTLRLLHYPPVKVEVFELNPNLVRGGEHSDYGSVTLLFQDNRGGLQVRSPTGQFVDAVPIEGTVVVNAGDLLARWSNDQIKSTLHQVIKPPKAADSDTYPARYSVAYFCNPNFKDEIDVLPTTYATKAEKKYGSINSGQYLAQRLSETY